MSVQTDVRWLAWAVTVPAPARLAKKLGGLANDRFMTYSLMLRNNVVEVVYVVPTELTNWLAIVVLQIFRPSGTMTDVFWNK